MDYQVARDTFVYGLLSGSSDLVTKASGGIFNKRVDSNVQPPYVVFDCLKDVPTTSNGTYWVMSICTMKVVAVVQDVDSTPKSYADAMADDIDTVMGAGPGLVNQTQNGFNFNVQRYSSIDLAMYQNQRPYRQRGYQYLVTVRYALPT